MIREKEREAEELKKSSQGGIKQEKEKQKKEREEERQRKDEQHELRQKGSPGVKFCVTGDRTESLQPRRTRQLPARFRKDSD